MAGSFVLVEMKQFQNCFKTVMFQFCFSFISVERTVLHRKESMNDTEKTFQSTPGTSGSNVDKLKHMSVHVCKPACLQRRC